MHPPIETKPASISLKSTLPHKDLLNLYLQLTGLIYAVKLGNNKLLRSANCAKLGLFLDLFKSSFVTFLRTPPPQRDKLDCDQLVQMVAILVYMLTLCPSPTKKPCAGQTAAIDLLAHFVAEFVAMAREATDLVLPGLHVALSFAESHQDGLIFGEIMAKNDNARFGGATVTLLNELTAQTNKHKSTVDYPLREERLLDGFVPMKNAHKDLAFRKYTKSGQLMSESDEALLRQARVVACFERLIRARTDSYLAVSGATNELKFELVKTWPEEKAFVVDIDKEAAVKGEQSEGVNSEAVTTELNEKSKASQLLLQQQQPPLAPQQTVRKKRQNVAISSLISNSNNNNNSNLNAESNMVSKRNILLGICFNFFPIDIQVLE